MNKNITLVAVIMLVAGLGGGYWLAGMNKNTGVADVSQAAAGDERKILFYRNPMNPSVTSPTPVQDSMGMDYIPVYAQSDKPKEKKALFYRNAMNPAVTSPVPA